VKKFVCDYCGQVFVRKRADVRGKHKFCSRKCYGAWLSATRKRRAQTKVTCAYCGKQFWKWNYRIDEEKHNFCSKVCASKWLEERTPPGRIECVCEVCGRTFKAARWHVENRGHGRFCSVECLAAYNANRMKAEGNPNWKGGISVPPYAYERFRPWRDKAVERDNRTCQMCGRTEEAGIHLEVHHIISVWEFEPDYQRAHYLSNLITLCRSCHAKVECGSLTLPDGRLEQAQADMPRVGDHLDARSGQKALPWV